MSIRWSRVALVVAAAMLMAACGSSSGGGGAYVASDASGSGDSTGGSDTTSSSNGDSTKNTASIQVKTDGGDTTKIDRSKPATADDAKVFGATNADKLLSLYFVDATGSTLVVTIDTAVHALPKKGIPMGEVNSSAFMVWTSTTGVWSSKSVGTIDIDVCPTKSAEPVVGAFHGVVAVSDLPGSIPNKTFDGPFNLVYWGGAGALSCSPPSTGGTTGPSDMGTFGKPAASTCNANPCDGGSNTSRNCCPYVPCLEPCFTKCALDAQSCFVGCGFDMQCPSTCMAKVTTCFDGCMTSCKVSDTCRSALQALNTCDQKAAETCDTGSEAGDDACAFDACCAENKAAF